MTNLPIMTYIFRGLLFGALAPNFCEPLAGATMGAAQVLPEEFETSIEIFALLLQHYGIAEEVIQLFTVHFSYEITFQRVR